MRDPETLKRILCDHDWPSPAHWVSALDELADLTDEDIARLERSASSCPRSNKTSRQ